MSTCTTHAPGAPNWFELATPEPERAKRFYTALMGWTANDEPIPEGGVYSIFQLEGRDVAACCAMPEPMRAAGVPAHWGVYFNIEDCDATVDAVRAAGGTVIAEPFEVTGALRMAVVRDPEGVAFNLFEPHQHLGVCAIREPRAIGWVELASRDIAAAEAFYTRVFGWHMEDHPAAPAPSAYRIFCAGGERQGGLLQMTPDWDGIPPHWSIYLYVEDVDAMVHKAVALGGSVHVSAFDAPGVGRIARIADPTGAGAYLIALGEG